MFKIIQSSCLDWKFLTLLLYSLQVRRSQKELRCIAWCIVIFNFWASGTKNDEKHLLLDYFIFFILFFGKYLIMLLVSFIIIMFLSI